MRAIFVLLALFALTLAACQPIAPVEQTSPAETSPTRGFTPSPALTQTETPTSPPTSGGPATLVIWVPPQFDPNSDSPAGEIFKSRLQAFSQRMPGVQVQVRVKAEEGPGGLYDSLSTASAAAPDALPDLVALPPQILQATALKGLLQPYDSLTIAMSDPDWYEYARQLAYLQSSLFGLPFAGDALLLVHRSEAVNGAVDGALRDWQAVLDAEEPLMFAAADPQALFTLSQYQANGGTVSDDQGRPSLAAEPLEGVLTFIAQANQAEVMPDWLIEYHDYAQLWQAFQDQRADQTIAWTSQYLTSQADELAATPLPTSSGEPYTLTTGWVWALARPHGGNLELSTRLAEFLTESSFLAEWTQALGYMPPRPSALEAWTDPVLQEQIAPVALSARLIPPVDVLTNLGPALQQATLAVLTKQNDPATAAETASQSLTSP